MANPQEPSNSNENNGQQQPLPIIFDEVPITYANFCRGTLSPEEVILDLGFNPNAFGVKVLAEDVEIKNRIILSPSAPSVYCSCSTTWCRTTSRTSARSKWISAAASKPSRKLRRATRACSKRQPLDRPQKRARPPGAAPFFSCGSRRAGARRRHAFTRRCAAAGSPDYDRVPVPESFRLPAGVSELVVVW